MKNILQIIILLTIGCGAFTQPNIKATKIDKLKAIQNPGLPGIKSGFTILYDSLITYSFTSESDSQLYAKFIYTYDGSSNLIERISYRWNKVDSIWDEDLKNEYAYDNSGRQTMTAIYSWNPLNSSWAGGNKVETGFDPAGNLIYYAYYPYWNTVNNTWVGSSKYESEFGDRKELLNRTNYWWNSSVADWGYINKDEYQYGNNGKQLLIMNFTWNADDSTWLLSTKVEDFYNESDSLISEVTSLWNSYDSSWAGDHKYDYSYDAATVIKFHYGWNHNTSVWDLNFRSEVTHDKNGKTILEIYYQYDHTGDQWVGTSKRVSTYDDNGNPASIIMYNWNLAGNDWLEGEKTVMQFDNEDRMIHQIRSFWNTETSAWEDTFGSDVIYNANGDVVTDGYYYYNYKYGGKTENIFNEDGIMVSFNEYYGLYENWTLTGKGYYYWTAVIESGTNDVPMNKAHLDIFPNPVTSTFRIEGFEGKATLYIYDLKGRAVFNKEITHNQEIDIKSLAEGIYVVRVNSSKGSLQTKLVKYQE